MNKPTETEIAFNKSAAFDKIAGYVLENIKKERGKVKRCSGDLMRRYLCVDDFYTCMILGALEEYFRMRKNIDLLDDISKQSVIAAINLYDNEKAIR